MDTHDWITSPHPHDADAGGTTPAAGPTVPEDLLARPVWTLADVAVVLRRPPSWVKQLVGTPGFPRPQRHNRQMWWLPSDILDWVGAPARPSSRRRSRRG